MKSINNQFIIATIVLGLGTSASVSANNSSIEGSLNQVIVHQKSNVESNLTEQLKQSIKRNAKQMMKLKSNNEKFTSTAVLNQQINQKTNLSNSTTEEE